MNAREAGSPRASPAAKIFLLLIRAVFTDVASKKDLLLSYFKTISICHPAL